MLKQPPWVTYVELKLHLSNVKLLFIHAKWTSAKFGKQHMNPMKINFLFHVIKRWITTKVTLMTLFIPKLQQHPGKNPVTLSDYEINHSGGKQNLPFKPLGKPLVSLAVKTLIYVKKLNWTFSYLLSNADEMKNIILDCAIVQKGATTPCLYLYLVAKYEEWYP